MRVGEFLKKFREVKGWSGRELAFKIGVDQHRMQKWEEGKGNPKLEDAERIRAYFNLENLAELSEEVLNRCIAGGSAQVPVDVIIQQKEELLAEKDKRINELNRTIQILEEALEAYKNKKQG